MGYTHYWSHEPYSDSEWKKLLDVADKVVAAAKKKVGGDFLYKNDDGVIWIDSQKSDVKVSRGGNVVSSGGGETFVFKQGSSSRFCKTRRLPYDAAVAGFLAAAKALFPDKMELDSDGDPQDKKRDKEWSVAIEVARAACPAARRYEFKREKDQSGSKHITLVPITSNDEELSDTESLSERRLRWKRKTLESAVRSVVHPKRAGAKKRKLNESAEGIAGLALLGLATAAAAATFTVAKDIANIARGFRARRAEAKMKASVRFVNPAELSPGVVNSAQEARSELISILKRYGFKESDSKVEAFIGNDVPKPKKYSPEPRFKDFNIDLRNEFESYTVLDTLKIADDFKAMVYVECSNHGDMYGDTLAYNVVAPMGNKAGVRGYVVVIGINPDEENEVVALHKFGETFSEDESMSLDRFTRQLDAVFKGYSASGLRAKPLDYATWSDAPSRKFIDRGEPLSEKRADIGTIQVRISKIMEKK